MRFRRVTHSHKIWQLNFMVEISRTYGTATPHECYYTSTFTKGQHSKNTIYNSFASRGCEFRSWVWYTLDQEKIETLSVFNLNQEDHIKNSQILWVKLSVRLRDFFNLNNFDDFKLSHISVEQDWKSSVQDREASL